MYNCLKKLSMCTNPASVIFMFMKEIDDIVLIPIWLKMFDITLCGIMGHTFERITRLIFIIRGLTESNRSLMSMFVLPDVSLSKDLLARYIHILSLGILEANRILVGSIY